MKSVGWWSDVASGSLMHILDGGGLEWEAGGLAYVFVRLLSSVTPGHRKVVGFDTPGYITD